MRDADLLSASNYFHTKQVCGPISLMVNKTFRSQGKQRKEKKDEIKAGLKESVFFFGRNEKFSLADAKPSPEHHHRLTFEIMTSSVQSQCCCHLDVPFVPSHNTSTVKSAHVLLQLNHLKPTISFHIAGFYQKQNGSRLHM